MSLMLTSPMVRADFEEAVKNLPVLLMFDIVDYDSILVSDVLRKEIDEKGILLYQNTF